MIKGINQAMVNRSIAGGITCKCVNGNSSSGGSSNGNGVNGGKITADLTTYMVEGDNKTYIKKDDAERVFHEVFSLDIEKYTFYQVITQMFDVENESMYVSGFLCEYAYSKNNESDMLKQVINLTYNNKLIIEITRKDGTIDYGNSNILSYNIVDVIPGTVREEENIKLILYYREY